MNPKIVDTFKLFYHSWFFHGLLIVIGFVLRLKHYLENRSLWLDEAYVALEVVSSYFREIFRFSQIFPEQAKSSYLFYVLEKSITSILGDSEFALRLIPLICSLLAILIFYQIIKKILSGNVVPLALGLFILCDAFVYYAAEVKQYSCDVMISLMLYWIFICLVNKEWTRRQVILLCAVGAVTIWSSFSSIIILSSMGVVLLVDKILGNQQRRWMDLCRIMVFYVFNLLVLYKVCLEPMFKSNYISGSIREKFISGPIFSIDTLVWIKKVCFEMIQFPGGLIFPLICWIIIICGCIEMYRRSKICCASLVLPFVLTLLAALLSKYPFFGRHIMFIIPNIFIFISAGVYFIACRVPFKKSLILLLTCFCLMKPIQMGVYHFCHPRDFEQMRPVMMQFKEHYQPGDFVYLNTSAQYPYWYYVSFLNIRLSTEQSGLWRAEKVYGNRAGRLFEEIFTSEKEKAVAYVYKIDNYNQDGYFRQPVFDQSEKQMQFLSDHGPNQLVKRKRVWLILSHIRPEVQDFIVEAFNREGRQISRFVQKGAVIYLYDLTYP